MKKRLCLFTLTILTIFMAWAQPWTYDFGTETGSFTEYNGESTTFLHTLSTGAASVRVASGGGGFTLQNLGLTSLGSESELKITAPTSTSNPNKFSIYDYTASKTFFIKFDILFGDKDGSHTANSGYYYFFQGDGATYNNDNAFTSSHVFTGIQWSFGSSGAITTSYRNAGSWSALGTTPPFAQGNVYTVEIYGNNSSSDATYSRQGSSYTVGVNKQDIWVDGSLIGNDLAKGQLPDNVNIDSFLFYGINSTGNLANCFLDNITYSNTLPGTPTITVNPESLTGFSFIEGSGPSSEKTFTVQGSNLTADISINAPTHYEISKTSGGTFSSSLTLTQSGGTVSATTIYVRLKTGLSAGNYDSEIITASSSGATSKTVTCSGTVCKPEPSNHCTNFTAANGTDPKTQIILSWTDATGSIIPDCYLIKAATGDYSNIANPVDGTAETDGTYVKNVAAGVQTTTFTNLADNTTYYFKIYPYTNSGENINYKTDGDIPQASGTTLVSQHLVAGDIAIIGFQSTEPDKFTILLLTSIAEGTDINLTDNGFNATGTLYQNEGTITWTAPEGGLSRGTVVTFTVATTWTVDKGSISTTSGSFNLAVDGDQIIVYQGQSSSPIFIYALSTTTWVTSGKITSNTSYIPTGLTNGSTCLALSSVTNCYYESASFTGTPSAALTSISDYRNWSTNSSAVTFPSWSFSIYDYPAGTPFEVNGVTVTVTGGNISIGSGDIPSVPNSNAHYTGFTLVLDNTVSNWTITIHTGAAYGAYYLDGNWNVFQGDGTQIVFEITFTKGRGEVEVPIILSDQDPTLPVELSSFTANINSQGGITVMWVTQFETGVNGYYVNRATVNNLSEALRISSLIPASNTSQQQVYVYNDNELYEPGTYYYWLEIQDIDGVVSYYGSRSVTFGGNDNNGTPEIPLVTGIRSIYPNPFNPLATIMYELEQPANVNIEIFNNRGQIVRGFNLGQKEKNRYKLLWDGTDNSGSACGTGIYFVKMQAGKETFLKKAALVK